MAELPEDLEDIIRRALDEDVGHGDVTTEGVIPANATARGLIVAKQSGVLAGLDVAAGVFRHLLVDESILSARSDGDRVVSGTVLLDVDGYARPILTGERVALNFLTHLSGIATLTREFVDACAGT